MYAPGWYPDPEGSAGKRYWDGENWTVSYPSTGTTAAPAVAPGVVEQRRRSRHPLFLVFAILSALPTAFFAVVWVVNPNTLAAVLGLWCALWTFVWWSMSSRH